MTLLQKETELRAKMAPLVEKAKNGEATADEVVSLKAMTDDLTALKAQMEAATDAEKQLEELANGKGVVTLDTSAKSESALLTKKGMEFENSRDLTAKQASIYGSKEHLAAFMDFFQAKGKPTNEATIKVVNEMIDSEGGFFVPPQFVDQVVERRPAPARLANLVTNFQAASNQVKYPTIRYTADNIYGNSMRPTLTGEQPSSATAANVTEPTFGETTINIHTYMATLPVSNDFIDDTVNFSSWITSRLMEMADQNIDGLICAGLGGNQGPLGLLTSVGATEGIASVNSTINDSFSWQDLVGLAFELPEQYAANASYVMNRVSAGKTAATLVGEDGQPVFRRGGVNNGLTDAFSDTLNGYPIVYSAHMPNIGNAALPIIFGDLSQYVLARRGLMTIKVQQETGYRLNQTYFTLRYRIGGTPVQPAAFRALLCI